MSLISISNLTFAYEGSYDNIFENVSFNIDTNWKLGFTGRNGRGKTTFLSLLMGKYEYSGVICAPAGFKYFPFTVADKTLTTKTIVRDICPAYQDWELTRELSMLEVKEDVLQRPFETLSNGEQTKVLLAALFLDADSYLLIDEPTNHLDAGGRKTVSRYLLGKSGYILVSHDRAFLDGCVDHILSINRANIEVQKGNFSSWFANKQRQDSFELAENEKLKKDIKRLTAAAKRSENWSHKIEKTRLGTSDDPGSKPGDRGAIGAQSARMMKKSKNIIRRQKSAVEAKSKLLKNIEYSDSIKVTQMPYHKALYLALSEVGISYGSNMVCQNVTLAVKRGDRIALNGKNGSGKSSLLKLICGEKISYTGDVNIGVGLQISYVSQDTSNLCGNLTDYAKVCGIDESLFKAILRKLDFSRVQFEKDMKDFSGGQKKKVLIARSLCEKSHLLVWDEPLNFVDVLSRIQIEELLLLYRPTILFVEHDHVFCDKIATGELVL